MEAALKYGIHGPCFLLLICRSDQILQNKEVISLWERIWFLTWSQNNSSPIFPKMRSPRDCQGTSTKRGAVCVLPEALRQSPCAAGREKTNYLPHAHRWPADRQKSWASLQPRPPLPVLPPWGQLTQHVVAPGLWLCLAEEEVQAAVVWCSDLGVGVSPTSLASSPSSAPC